MAQPVQYPAYPAPSIQPAPGRPNNCCLYTLCAFGCGGLLVFFSTLAFFAITLKMGDRLSSPATTAADRFLAHVSAGDYESAHAMLDPVLRERWSAEDLEAELGKAGISGFDTWDKKGAVWSSGAVTVEAGIPVAGGGTNHVYFKAEEVGGEWVIFEFGPIRER